MGAAKVAPAGISGLGEAATGAAAPKRKKDPRDLRDMNRRQLEVVARQYRVRECDVVNLTDDRLRNNILAKMEETFA